jgi:hypothetical protein
MTGTASALLGYLPRLPARQKHVLSMAAQQLLPPVPLPDLYHQSRAPTTAESLRSASCLTALLEAIRGKGKPHMETLSLANGLRPIKSNWRFAYGQIHSHLKSLQQRIPNKVREKAGKFFRLSHPKPLSSHRRTASKYLASLCTEASAQQ